MNDLVRSGLLIAFLAFFGVRRFRARNGVQPVKPRRFMLRVLMIGSVTASLIWFVTPSPLVLAGGLGLGLSLGLYALKLTELEAGVTHTMFKPNPWIGNLIFGLFALRVAWRLGRRFFSEMPIGHRLGLDAPGRPPWTTMLLLVLMSYGITYMGGLIVRGSSIPRLPAPANEISDDSAGG